MLPLPEGERNQSDYIKDLITFIPVEELLKRTAAGSKPYTCLNFLKMVFYLYIIKEGQKYNYGRKEAFIYKAKRKTVRRI